MSYCPVSVLSNVSKILPFIPTYLLEEFPDGIHLLAFTQTECGASGEPSSDGRLLPLQIHTVLPPHAPPRVLFCLPSWLCDPWSTPLMGSGCISRLLPSLQGKSSLPQGREVGNEQKGGKWLEKGRSQAKKRGID